MLKKTIVCKFFILCVCVYIGMQWHLFDFSTHKKLMEIVTQHIENKLAHDSFSIAIAAAASVFVVVGSSKTIPHIKLFNN